MEFFGDNCRMNNEISRRGFICAALATATGVAISGTSAEAAGGISILRDGRVEVDLSKYKVLSKVGGALMVGNVKNSPTALSHVFQSAPGGFADLGAATLAGLVHFAHDTIDVLRGFEDVVRAVFVEFVCFGLLAHGG